MSVSDGIALFDFSGETLEIIKIGDEVGLFTPGPSMGRFIGFGRVVSIDIPPQGGTKNAMDVLGNLGVPVPRILLKNGTQVWGLDYFFASRERIEKFLPDRKVCL